MQFKVKVSKVVTKEKARGCKEQKRFLLLKRQFEELGEKAETMRVS